MIFIIPREFQAIVSVIAVNIQFSSPIGVLLSFSLPGILSSISDVIVFSSGFMLMNHLRPIEIGVVRQLVKTSFYEILLKLL